MTTPSWPSGTEAPEHRSKNFEMGWIMDYCAQALRHIIIGMGGKMDGFMMKSSFGIAVSSEVMAILSVFTSLEDLRTRLKQHGGGL